jgi:biotin carboxylase
MRAAAFPVWRQMGLQVVLVDGYSSARYEHLANEFWPLDARDGSADLARITELARGCQGITTLADNSQSTVATVAENLGLPGVGSAAAAVARSKLRQREVCERAGMPVPRWRQVRGPDDLREFFADGARPAVLKPVDAAGGAGVLRVGDLDGALGQWRVVRSLSPSRTVVVEDYLEGREVCVDAVVSGGEPVFVSLCEADVVGPEGFIAVSARYATRQPDHAGATGAVRRLATVLGVSEAMVHAEFRIDGDRWTLLETALRPGGALVPELTVLVTGVHLYEAQARIALGEPAPLPPAPPTPPAPYAQVRFLLGEGQVRAFVPPARILADLPDVRVVHQMAGPGARVRLPVSDEGRAGYAAGWGTDPGALDAQLREAITRLGQAMGLRVRDDADVAA